MGAPGAARGGQPGKGGKGFALLAVLLSALALLAPAAGQVPVPAAGDVFLCKATGDAGSVTGTGLECGVADAVDGVTGAQQHTSCPGVVAPIPFLTLCVPTGSNGIVEPPSLVNLFHCDEFTIDEGQCAVAGLVDGLTGAQPEPGCSGIDDPVFRELFCIPTNVGVNTPGGAPSLQDLLQCQGGIFSGQNECAVAAIVDGVTGAPPTGAPSPLCLLDAAFGANVSAVSCYGTVGDPTCLAGGDPTCAVPAAGECQAVRVWGNGRGPITLGSDRDIGPGLDTINGVCPGPAPFSASIPSIPIDGARPAASTAPPFPPGVGAAPLISVSGTTQSLLIDAPTLSNPAGDVALLLSGVQHVTVVGLNATGLTVRVEDSQDVTFAGLRAAQVELVGSSVTLIGSTLDGTGTVLDVDGGSTVVLGGNVPGRVGTLRFANGDATVVAPRFIGAAASTGACIAASSMATLELRQVLGSVRCPGGLVDATADAITLDGVKTESSAGGAFAARLAAATALTVTNSTLKGGQTPLLLAGAGGGHPAWSVGRTVLDSSGPALLGLDSGLGDGTVTGSVLKGNGALLQALGGAPATRPVVRFVNDHVARATPETVIPADGTFDTRLELHLDQPPVLAPGGNVRGGRFLAGNWWDRAGLVLWDGDGDGLSEVPLAVLGTAARDTHALVPANTAPHLDVHPDRELGHPFTHLFAGAGVTLTGSATDREDGALTPTWQMDGVQVAAGNTTTVTLPAAGPHTLSGVATDTLGATARVSYTFTVLDGNAEPALDGLFYGPCGATPPAGRAGVARVGEPLCLRAQASDPKAGVDDALDALVLDRDGDGRIGDADLRLSRLVVPPVDQGLVGPVGFGHGSALHAFPAAKVVANGLGAFLDLAGNGRVDPLDLRLGPFASGSRVLGTDADNGTAAAPLACGLGALALAGADAYVDADCSHAVSPGDLRLGAASIPVRPGVDPATVQAGDRDVGAALVALSGTVGSQDRDAELSTVWNLGVDLVQQTAAGDDAQIVPSAPGNALLTAIVVDRGEPVRQAAKSVTLSVLSDAPPAPDFKFTPSTTTGAGASLRTTVFRNSPVSLTDLSRPEPATPIVNWTWVVSSGSGSRTVYGPAPTVSFPVLGPATVRLTVLGANGKSASLAKDVEAIQTPPTPLFEVLPADAQVAGTPLRLVADGSPDIGAVVTPLGGSLAGGLRLLDGQWLVDADGNGLASDGDVLFGDATGLLLVTAGNPVLGRPVSSAVGAASLCFADLDQDGAVSRGRGVEPLFLVARATCGATQAGDTRLQAPAGASGRAGSRLAANDPDSGLALRAVPGARIGTAGAAPARRVVLDVDGSGTVTPEDERLQPDLGRLPGSRVLPPSTADGGGALQYTWTCLFGCGAGPQQLATGAHPVASFATSGRKVLQLTVVDASGNRVDQSAPFVVLNQAPTPAVAVLAGSSTDLDDILLDARGSHDVDGPDASLSYDWDFSDGTRLAGAVVTKRFAAPGAYWANLTVTDSDDVRPAAQQLATRLVIGNSPPQPSFTFLPLAPTTLTPVAFDGRASRDLDGLIGPDGYHWTFTEGATQSTADGPLATHAYGRAGTYPVSLQVRDDRGALTTLTRSVTVLNQAPHARLDLNRTVALPPAAIQFSSDASSDPELSGPALLAVVWDFGDGSSSAQHNPVHTYTGRGAFTVRLTVTDPDGASDSTTAVVTLLNEPARASLVVPTQGTVRQAIAFKALGFDPEGDALTYRWDFGDGTMATGALVSHAYSAIGVYTLTMRLADAGGAETVLTRTLEILSTPPKATLAVDHATAHVGDTVVAEGSATDPDPDGSIAGHFLDFGDGTSSFNAKASHIYLKPGTYTVTYRATDNTGLAGEATKTVTVDNPPPAVDAIQVTPAAPRPGDILLFQAKVPPEPGLQYTWDFKDGTVSDQAAPIHVYQVAGQFNVELKVRDSLGAVTKTMVEVKVVDPNAPAQPASGDAGASGTGDPPTVDAQREGTRGAAMPAAGLLLVGLLALAARRRR